MTTKKHKKKEPRLPKFNEQLPISRVRKLTFSEPSEIAQNARQYPIYGCWAMQNWEEAGITPLIVARQIDANRILFANYLIDLYCLGVKDVYVKVVDSPKQFERELTQACHGEAAAISIELAHEIVYGSIEFARKYGFEPHPDFFRLHADEILDPPEAHPRTYQVEFGKDGKPLYIAGHHDSEIKIRSILSTLKRSAGEGNYHFLIPIPSPDDYE